MGIASRLFRIVKANFQRSRGKTEADPISFDIPFPSGSQAKSEPKRDPVLAKYYANLEIPYGSDLPAVKTAWKKLMRKYHPDLHGTDSKRREMAETLAQGLNLAYKELEKHLKSQ